MIAPARRDSVVWTLLFLAAIGGYIGAHTHLLTPDTAETLKDLATTLGFAAGLLKASPLGPGKPRDIEPPREAE